MLKFIPFLGIDQYTHLSFAVSGMKDLEAILDQPYVGAVDHPGMILFVPKETISEKVTATLKLLGSLWPIFVVNIVLIALAGIIFISLVRNCSYIIPILIPATEIFLTFTRTA